MEITQGLIAGMCTDGEASPSSLSRDRTTIMNTVVRKPICGALAARTATWLAYLAASLVVAHSAALVAKESPLPEVSPEGLQLQKGTKLRAVYLKPGATFDQFDRVMIVDVFVQFDKD